MYKPKGPQHTLAMNYMTGEIKLLSLPRATQISGGQRTCCGPPNPQRPRPELAMKSPIGKLSSPVP